MVTIRGRKKPLCHQSNHEPLQPTKLRKQFKILYKGKRSPKKLHAESRTKRTRQIQIKLPFSLQHKICLPKLKLQPCHQVRACLEGQESPWDHRNAAKFLYSGRSCWSLYIEKDEVKLISSQMQQLQPDRRLMWIKSFSKTLEHISRFMTVLPHMAK